MTGHGPALLALSVLAIAGWTYNVNYDTRAALDRLDALRAGIAEEREALQVLRVEWAYLNAPDRLVRLLGSVNDRLALGPLKPEALGYVAAVPYPKDLPFQPGPLSPPEAMVAAAPQQDSDMGTLALIEATSEDSGAVLTDGEVSAETAAVEPALEPDVALAAAGGAGTEPALADPALVDAPGDASEPTLIAVAALPPAESAAEVKAEALGVDTGGLSMAEAVALALAEAGVVEAKMPAPIVQASAPAGTPMPRARPAVWGALR